MTYSSCLHDQQDLCWGNTSRDTSEESQESQQQTTQNTYQIVKVLENSIFGYIFEQKEQSVLPV